MTPHVVRSWLRRLGLEGEPKQQAVVLLEQALGRRELWRLGRLAYLHARRDGPNIPEISGEYRLHDTIARHCATRGSRVRILDIGASTGAWAEHMLRAAVSAGLDDIKLWALEPSGDPRSALQQTLTPWVERGQAVVRPDAVADTVGEAEFDATPGLGQSKHLIVGDTNEHHVAASTPRVRVPVTTVDQLMQELALPDVAFIKSDVEGFDLQVLRGASETLRQERVGILQFEYNHRWVATRSFLRDVFELAAELPYLVGKVVPEGIDLYPSWHHELETFFEANYVLVHRDWVAPLGACPGAFGPSNTYERKR